MKRRPDWQVKLNDYLVKTQKKSFGYGKFDCCIFAAGAVKAMTGKDPMKEFRGKYASEKESKEALKNIGKGTLYRTLTSKFGRPVPATMGQRGDIAYDKGRLGLIIGREALFLCKDGFSPMPINQVGKAFRVPF